MNQLKLSSKDLRMVVNHTAAYLNLCAKYIDDHCVAK